MLAPLRRGESVPAAAGTEGLDSSQVRHKERMNGPATLVIYHPTGVI